jgi:hypothetical protein
MRAGKYAYRLIIEPGPEPKAGCRSIRVYDVRWLDEGKPQYAKREVYAYPNA